MIIPPIPATKLCAQTQEAEPSGWQVLPRALAIQQQNHLHIHIQVSTSPAT